MARKSEEELLEMIKQKEEKIVNKRKKLEQRINEKRNKIRTHLMCEYGGKVEEAFKKIFDRSLYVNENKDVIDLIFGLIIKNMPKYKNEIEEIIEKNEKIRQEEQNDKISNPPSKEKEKSNLDQLDL